eukprot:scaffold63935_cov36-Phaeocystis_antarctica.AAC.1
MRSKKVEPAADNPPKTRIRPHEDVDKLIKWEKTILLRLHARFKLAEALPATPMSIVQRPTCLDLATLPYHGTHQTSMPLCSGSSPRTRTVNTAAATTQVHPAPCQSRSSKVKVVERQEQ